MATTHTGPISDMMLRLLVLLAVVLLAAGVAIVAVRGFNEIVSEISVKSSHDQALYLSNGKVYYGHLSQINDGYLKLSSAYSSSTVLGKTTITKVSDIGGGVEDTLYVSRGEVLYWQNLQAGGAIATAITNYSGPVTVNTSSSN